MQEQIQAEDLRIGNYLLFDGKDIDSVTEIFSTGINAKFKSRWDFDRLSGIVLTPEILEKCGFEKAPSNDQWGGYLSPPTGINKTQQRIVFGEHYEPLRKKYWSHFIGTGKYDGYHIRIDYLHQLQNLIWVLTQTELPVKL